MFSCLGFVTREHNCGKAIPLGSDFDFAAQSHDWITRFLRFLNVPHLSFYIRRLILRLFNLESMCLLWRRQQQRQQAATSSETKRFSRSPLNHSESREIESPFFVNVAVWYSGYWPVFMRYFYHEDLCIHGFFFKMVAGLISRPWM